MDVSAPTRSGSSASRIGPPVPRGAVGRLVLVVVATLLADGARLGLGHTEMLRRVYGASVGVVGLSDRVWFVVLVAGPVALMLLGGHLLGRGLAVGRWLGWWAVLFAAVDGLWSLVLAPRLDWGRPAASTIVMGAGLLQVLAATFAAQAMLRRTDECADGGVLGGLTARRRDQWTVVFVVLVVGYGIVLWRQAGVLPLGVIAGSMLGGIVGWRWTTARRPADPAVHVPLFLLLLALFMVHVGEESLTGFNRAISVLSGTPWQDRPFTELIGLLGPTVWVFGAWSLGRRRPFGNFILWFMIVGMILGEPTHLVVFPVMAMWRTGGGYGYFPGMWTSLLPMIPAVVALRLLVREHRRALRLTGASRDPRQTGR